MAAKTLVVDCIICHLLVPEAGVLSQSARLTTIPSTQYAQTDSVQKSFSRKCNRVLVGGPPHDIHCLTFTQRGRELLLCYVTSSIDSAHLSSTYRNGAFVCRWVAKTVFHSEISKIIFIDHLIQLTVKFMTRFYSFHVWWSFVFPVEFPNIIAWMKSCMTAEWRSSVVSMRMHHQEGFIDRSAVLPQ